MIATVKGANRAGRVFYLLWLEGQNTESRFPFFDDDQGTRHQSGFVVPKRSENDWRHVFEKNILAADLQNTWPSRLGQCQNGDEIQVVGEDNTFIR